MTEKLANLKGYFENEIDLNFNLKNHWDVLYLVAKNLLRKNDPTKYFAHRSILVSNHIIALHSLLDELDKGNFDPVKSFFLDKIKSEFSGKPELNRHRQGAKYIELLQQLDPDAATQARKQFASELEVLRSTNTIR